MLSVADFFVGEVAFFGLAFFAEDFFAVLFFLVVWVVFCFAGDVCCGVCANVAVDNIVNAATNESIFFINEHFKVKSAMLDEVLI